MKKETQEQPSSLVETGNPNEDKRFKTITDLVRQRVEELGFNFSSFDNFVIIQPRANQDDVDNATSDFDESQSHFTLRVDKLHDPRMLSIYYTAALLQFQIQPTEFKSDKGIARNSVRKGFEMDVQIDGLIDGTVGEEFNTTILYVLGKGIIEQVQAYDDEGISSTSSYYYVAKRFCAVLGEDRILAALIGSTEDYSALIQVFDEVSKKGKQSSNEIQYYSFFNEVNKMPQDDVVKAKEITDRYFGSEKEI